MGSQRVGHDWVTNFHFHSFWVVVFSLSFVSRYFLISLLILQLHVYYLEMYCLTSMCLCFWQFFFFLQMISSLIALWSEKVLDRVSYFLNLLSFDLWPKMWSILENVPCALEKKVYSSAFGWNVLKISMRSMSSNVSFKTCVSLLIFCFDDLSIGVSDVLNSPTIIVLLSVSPFMSVSVCLMCWGAHMLGT